MNVSPTGFCDRTTDAPLHASQVSGVLDPRTLLFSSANQWHCGMKTHIGMDSRTKLIHSVAASAANVHDSQMLPDLLHGKETRVWGDAAYSGQRHMSRHHVPHAQSFIQTKAHRHRPLSEAERARNRTKSKVRAKVEPVFLVIKRILGWAKVRYRGLAKNTHGLFFSCGLANLYVARRRPPRGWS